MLVLAGVFVGVVYASTEVPSPESVVSAQTTVVYYADGKTEMARIGQENRTNVTLAQVSKPAQHAVLAARNVAYNRQMSGTWKQAAERRAERVAYQEEGRGLARTGDRLFVAGCMLYWAEGAKHRNCLKFTNSDPEMVRFFVRFIRSFDVEDDAFRLTCNLFADHVARQDEIEQFWLDVARLPRSCLCKSSVNVYSKYSQKKRQNKLPFGTCRISMCRTWLVQTTYGGIQELGGFTRDAWLD